MTRLDDTLKLRQKIGEPFVVELLRRDISLDSDSLIKWNVYTQLCETKPSDV
jgi:hypothetical protein